MLRVLFGEPPRQEQGQYLHTVNAIRDFNRQLRKTFNHGEVDNKWVRLNVWAIGLHTALSEFEQSLYCSHRFGQLVSSSYLDVMTAEERADYYRHIYFYKDAVIRLFSLLDKTGYFLDLLYGLETAKVKQKFSYFTVLRQMHKTNTHKRLEQKLFDLKVKYREPLDKLRKKRNLEIHSLNAELIDDNWHTGTSFITRIRIEPIKVNSEELQHSMDMVCQSLTEIFRYSKGVLR